MAAIKTVSSYKAHFILIYKQLCWMSHRWSYSVSMHAITVLDAFMIYMPPIFEFIVHHILIHLPEYRIIKKSGEFVKFLLRTS